MKPEKTHIRGPDYSRDVVVVADILKNAVHGVTFGDLHDRLPPHMLCGVSRLVVALKNLIQGGQLERSRAGRYTLAR